MEDLTKRRNYFVMLDEVMEELALKRVNRVTKVIANDNAVIVFFGDGSKNVMKLAKGDKYDIETAVAFAIAQKLYGSNSAFKKSVAKILVDCRGEQKSDKRRTN